MPSDGRPPLSPLLIRHWRVPDLSYPDNLGPPGADNTLVCISQVLSLWPRS